MTDMDLVLGIVACIVVGVALVAPIAAYIVFRPSSTSRHRRRRWWS